jgi:phosphatidylserine/phosphatidylglycerophosphate/cardiolipin synthase-like enzyme
MAKRKKKFDAKAIDGVIQANLKRLRKPGVLTVRPGYEIAGHQLTGAPAIVATVHTKKKELAPGDALPNSIAGTPVDVREATAHQRLRATDPSAAALTQAYGRPEDREPDWPYEREMPSGKFLAGAKSSTAKALAAHAQGNTATHRALTSHATKPEIKYVPANASLDPVTVTTTITAHVSPDAGLKTLQGFLAGTTDSLIIGMYDFTSGTILKNVESALNGKKTLKMVLDNPAPNPTRDQTDTQTVDDLNASLKARSQIVRALDRADTYAAAWIFPYAYHIKVIVRDGTTFWLSSGNLNNSNQPDLASPPSTEDRDWHVIIENEGLAKVFAAFLNQDFVTASQHQAKAASDVTSTVADAHAKLAAYANPPPPRRPSGQFPGSVPAKTFKNVSVTITPLLTPDEIQGDLAKKQYFSQIVQLIESAQESLYIQLQYIESSQDGTDYDALLRSIAGRVAAGVKVQLIESLDYGEKWAEKMKATGVDLTANIRLQKSVHNKGFVVDSKIAVVSSQNFSPAGIEENRDAGVILENAAIARYFEAVFQSDWDTRAKPFAPKAGGAAKGTPAKKTHRAKKGIKRVSGPTGR